MDPILILLVAVLGVFIVFQIRNGRKRRQETETRQAQFLPGVEVMTNYGLYGTIVSIDDDKNLAVIETSPGNEIKIHRQTILKLADYDTVPEGEAVEESAVVADEFDSTSEASGPRADADPIFQPEGDTDGPRFGERVDDAPKPARSADKTGEQ